MERTFFAFCLWGTCWATFAGEIETSLNRLEAALRKGTEERTNKPSASAGETIRGGDSLAIIPYLRERLREGDLQGAKEMLRSYSGMALSEEERKATEELLVAMRRDQELRDQAITARTEELYKRASDSVKNAKLPADLDSIIQELSAEKERVDTRRAHSLDIQAVRNKAERTYHFVTGWQDYLAAQASGNEEHARNLLKNLANAEVMLVPRSEILAKSQALERLVPNQKTERPVDEMTEEIVAKARTLDDVSAALKELRALQSSRRGSNSTERVSSIIQALEQIDRNYREFRAGLPVNVELPSSGSTGAAATAPLKSQLVLLVMPRYIGAPLGTNAKEGEDLPAFLNRVMNEAKSRGDSGLALRAKEASRQMQRISTWTANDSEGLRFYQAAQNQEAAGQYLLAVVSYQNALKTGSDIVDPTLIGQRLADIRKNHSDDFEKGMERFHNPYAAAPRYGPPGYPVLPGRTEPTPKPGADQPKLSIPAAPAATPASPTPSPQDGK